MSTELDTLFTEFNQEEALAGAKCHGDSEDSAKTKKLNQEAPAEKYAKSMLFVRGVPKDATNQELEEYFSNVGPVRSCFVVTEKKPAATAEDVKEEKEEDKEKANADEPVRNRGFGFVQFVLAEDAARAVEELSEAKFRGKKRLMLDFAIRKNLAHADNGSSGKDPLTRKRSRSDSNDAAKERPAKLPKTRPTGTKVESKTIILSNIPKDVTKKHLVKKAKKTGDPHSVVYPIPAEEDKTAELQEDAGGTAYITFADHKTAMKALNALNNHTFKGAKLSVKLKSEYVDKNARLIVRNLPFKVRERELEKLFSSCGTVLQVDLPRKFAGGPLRGFAFVQMGDLGSAYRAIEQWNNHEIQGRVVTVDFSVSKDKFKEMEEKGEVEKSIFERVEAPAVEEDPEKEQSDQEVASEKEEEEDVVDESLQEGCTLFLRNLSFESDEDGLFELFKPFGRLRYCRIVYDPQTGRSRGTAFVCFWNPADAAKCLEEAQKSQDVTEKLSNVPSDKLADQRNKSVLLQEAPTSLDSTSKFSLDGRVLSIAKAVDRNTAHDLATEGLRKRRSKDNRNTYLLKEGVIFPDTPSAEMMAPADLEHHIKEYGVRKNQIQKNPNLYMSKIRLTVHNIPRSVDDAGLRGAAMSSIDKFKQEIKDKKRQPLSQDEMEEGWDKRPRVTHAKIVRSTDRVDASSGKGRSKGYGFLGFNTHAHALACLRYLNFSNSKQAFAKYLVDDEVEADSKVAKSDHKISRRSIRVMFAIENAQVVKKREMRFALSAKKRAAPASGKAAKDEAGEPRRRKAKKNTIKK